MVDPNAPPPEGPSEPVPRTASPEQLPRTAPPEPIPSVSPDGSSPPLRTSISRTSTGGTGRHRASSSASARLRSASFKLIDSPMPAGMWAATGEAAASRLPSVRDIRSGGADGTWRRGSQDGMGGMERRGTGATMGTIGEGAQAPSRRGTGGSLEGNKKGKSVDLAQEEGAGPPDYEPGRGKMANQTFDRSIRTGGDAPPVDKTLDEHDEDSDADSPAPRRRSKNIQAMLGEDPTAAKTLAPSVDEKDPAGPALQPTPNTWGVYPNGYQFPPKKPWTQSFAIGFRAFLRFSITVRGFLIVLYGLNVVAWGGMLFLLLCNASPAMCRLGDGRFDCNDIDSPRRVWVEIDSQILNALFCVTGFGLAPWRFRDLWYLLQFRLGKRVDGLRKLAGYHRSWFRLPGSDRLPVQPRVEPSANDDSDLDEHADDAALPLPAKRAPDQPLTGARAAPTPLWKLDYVVWCFVANTFLQVVLSVFMWRLNRYDRPSWSTGLFVGLACVVAAMGGLMQFVEGKRVKKVEGVPVDTEDLVRDVEKAEGPGDVGNAQASGGGSKWKGLFRGKSRTEPGV